MRKLLVALMAACACIAAGPAPPVPSFPPVMPVQAGTEICASDPLIALQRRLALDGVWANDPVAGPMNLRMMSAHIATNSVATLMTGLARYSRPTVLLITYAGAGGSCSWAVTKDGVAAYARSKLDSQSLKLAVREVFAAIDVTGASTARALKHRGDPAPASIGAPVTAPDPAMAATSLRTIASSVLAGEVGATLARYDQVFIAPDASLLGFPFAMLPVPTADGQSAPLIERAAIQIAPGIGQIGIGPGVYGGVDWGHRSPEARRAAFAQALIVGNPAFADPEFPDAPALPGAEREARRVAEIMGVHPLIGADARLQALRAKSGPSYVHIASHGLADMDSAVDNRSFMLLAGGDRLYAPDLVSMPKDAIVVLSACQTGLGAERPGGVVGLPRLFQRNGAAQTVVMSLWNVDDEATGFMMEQFARELVQAGNPATAHARAVRATRAKFPEPKAWASFLVFGAGQF